MPTSSNFAGEWGGVQPAAFIASGGTLTPTFVGDQNANSLLYAVIAPGETTDGSHELYLMYDYTGRTSSFTVGDFVASVQFPVVFDQTLYPNATVELTAGATPTTPTVNVNLNGTLVEPADDVGIDAAVGFGPSTLSLSPHLLLELEVTLNIPDSFGGNFFTSGSGAYSPDPAFWQASAVDNAGDPPITSALFSINPNGSISINADAQPTPEPSSVALLVVGVAGLGLAARRHKGRGR